MDNHPAWQRMVDELAGDDEVARAELQEIGRWFPSVEMLANHARGLIDVMTDDEKRRALVDGPGTPPANILRFAMAETRSDDPRQRARWWMYRSATTPQPQPDPKRVWSRMQRVQDMVLALPAPAPLVHIDDDDVSLSSDSEYCKVNSDNDSGYRGDSDSSDSYASSDTVEVSLVVLSDDKEEAEEDEIQMVAPVHNAREGDRDLPIDVEVLPDVPDIVKQELVEEEPKQDAAAEPARIGKKRSSPVEVRRSERLKRLKM